MPNPNKPDKDARLDRHSGMYRHPHLPRPSSLWPVLLFYWSVVSIQCYPSLFPWSCLLESAPRPVHVTTTTTTTRHPPPSLFRVLCLTAPQPSSPLPVLTVHSHWP
eukprot:TRINITY_DN521_c0_g1_i1.p2 TRINITY_DN521_c0_g1~~TRINITY_DN521_c0_g1_i1.p2  ORF type:complete len:106 (-),score=2.87 TRINITY_DN521_c0_g1_i1:113-430(-)